MATPEFPYARILARALFVTACFLSFVFSGSYAQTCAASYFQKQYTSPDHGTPYASAINNKGETLIAGSQSPDFSSKSQGWIAKLTPQGSMVWNRVITVTGYDNVTFSGAVALPDGGFLLAGTLITIDAATQALKRGWGFVCRIDNYGNISWTRGFSNYSEETNVTFLRTIIRTGDDDFLIFGELLGHKPPFIVRGTQEIMRINGNGDVRWRTSVSSDIGYILDADRIGYTFTNNGSQVVLGLEMDKRELVGLGYGLFYEQGYALLNLDYNSGAHVWDHAYSFPLIVTLNGTARTGIPHISTLPDGGFALGFSFAENEPLGVSPGTKRAALMITDGNGIMKKVIGYTNGQPGISLVDAIGTSTAGEQVILFGDGKNALLANVNGNGDLLWQKAYTPADPKSFPLSLQPFGQGYQIVERLNDGGAELIRTDALGKMDCTETTSTITNEDITSMFSPAATDFRFLVGKEKLPLLNAQSKIGTWKETTNCIEACCRDTIDLGHTKEWQLCAGATITLPDNVVVRDTGMYYVTYKTAKGCDSIIYHHVVGVPDPSTLRITGSPCMNGKDTIILSATPGFPAYQWQPSAGSGADIAVTAPGLYTVSVNTSCGNHAESMQVYADCPDDIIMPNAFTPNGDGLNDLFRVPPANLLELKLFRVFDRFGKKVFETREASQGWDGNFKGVRQPVGTYVYTITMKGLDGRDLKASGTITLMR